MEDSGNEIIGFRLERMAITESSLGLHSASTNTSSFLSLCLPLFGMQPKS